MFSQLLAHYIGVETPEVDRLLALGRSGILADSKYQALRSALPADRLFHTLEKARDVYGSHMLEYHKQLNFAYGVDSRRMSAYTLGNWLVTYLQFPNIPANLPEIHKKLPPEAVQGMLPVMLLQLGEMPEGATDWQRALAVLALPLAASAN